MTNADYSHLAFSDESRHNVGRFRAIAVLTCSKDQANDLRERAHQIIQRNGLKEFKWHKLRQARDRFAALGLLGLSLEALVAALIRIDILTWDIRDSRHDIARRDDNANLGRMYYHLLRNVMRLRWQNDAVWLLHPDQHSSMDWNTISEVLRYKSHSFERVSKDMFSSPTKIGLAFRRDFGIHAIEQVESHQEPLAQIADLFAGIAAYSYSVFDRYLQWIRLNQPQIQFEFIDQHPLTLSNSERERFLTLKTFSDACKANKLGVSLNSSRGLRTYAPSYPLNFWKYEPQSYLDKAPTK